MRAQNVSAKPGAAGEGLRGRGDDPVLGDGFLDATSKAQPTEITEKLDFIKNRRFRPPEAQSRTRGLRGLVKGCHRGKGAYSSAQKTDSVMKRWHETRRQTPQGRHRAGTWRHHAWHTHRPGPPPVQGVRSSRKLTAHGHGTHTAQPLGRRFGGFLQN